MNKPEDIPQDVWDAALALVNDLPGSMTVGEIAARAIMAGPNERKVSGLNVIVGPVEYDEKGNMRVSWIPSYFPPALPMTVMGEKLDRPLDVPEDIWASVSAVLWYGMDFGAAVHSTCSLIMAELKNAEDLLKNPAAVRLNYLRGGIACQHLIDEAVSAEREACAEEMDRRWRENANTAETRAAYSNAAAAIRNRGAP